MVATTVVVGDPVAIDQLTVVLGDSGVFAHRVADGTEDGFWRQA
jgi:hypothetical protein